MRTLISILLIICISIGLGSPSYSQEFESTKGAVIEEKVRRELMENGLTLENLTIEHNRIGLQVALSGGYDEKFFMELLVGTNQGKIVEVQEGKASSEGDSKSFIINEKNQVSFIGEDHFSESVQGKTIPLPVIVMLPAAVLDFLAKAGLLILIGGLVYIIVTELIPRLEKAIKQNRKLPRHYMAIRHKNGVFAGPGLTFSEAVGHGRAGGDTWSFGGKKGARAIAKTIQRGRKPIGPEKDKLGENKLCHYHPHKKLPPMHAFYGRPSTVCQRKD